MSALAPGTRARLAEYRQWASGNQKAGPACAIINADDWGRAADTTDTILDCMRTGSVRCASGMVFMADSERAAEIARDKRLDVGLHLNLTTPFSGATLPARLSEHHQAVASYLRRSSYNRYIYHPGLTRSFDYVVASQIDEFTRLYGAQPRRVDGHHHMHLCANVIIGHLLTRGLIIRPNLCFVHGEKNLLNRSARRCYDSLLSRRYRMVDALVTLAPLQPATRLARIFSWACQQSVEIETHPTNAVEHVFLTNDSVFQFAERVTDV